MRKSGTFITALSLASALASGAMASRIPSDTPTVLSIGDACTIGAGPCAASALGIGSYSLDSALGTNVYVYTNGIVSLNAPLPDTANPADPSTLGTSFLAPGLTSGSYSVGAYFPGPDVYDPTAADAGSLNDVFILFSTGTTLFGVDIKDDGPMGATSLSKIDVSYAYGTDLASGDFPAGSGDYPTANLPDGAFIGYDVGGKRYWELAPADPGLFSYGGTFNALGTPEPQTWALMFIGFGAIGASLRRSRTLGRAA